VIAIDPPRAEGASAYVRFWNSDGEETGACGNGTRCVAWLLMQSGQQGPPWPSTPWPDACRA
jgi:diaminopimelate epimerase